MGFTSGSYDTSKEAEYARKRAADAAEAERQRYLGAQGPQRRNYGYGPIDISKLSGYNMLRNLATQRGPSQEAQYSLMQNLMNRQNMMDASSKAQAGAYGQAISQLGSQGGVGAGARERLSQQGIKNKLMGTQDAYRSAGTNLLDILKADQANKTKALGDFGGLEQSYAKGNMDIVKDIYNQDIARWGAARQAGDTASEFYNYGIGGAGSNPYGLSTSGNQTYDQGMFSNPNPMTNPQGPMVQGGPVGPKMGVQPPKPGQYSIMNNLKSGSF